MHRLAPLSTAHDFHWLVGILEGEATFGAAPPSRPGIPFLRVCMTDLDVIERVARLWDRALITLPARQAHYRVPYATVIRGAPAVAVMLAARPYPSGERRTRVDMATAS